MKDIYCSFCGNLHNSQSYPKKCDTCNNVSYINPLPAAVVCLKVCEEPHKCGVLLIDRNIPPFGWALPGGYMEVDETWQEASSRELFEETGLKIRSSEFLLNSVKTGPDGKHLLLLSIAYTTKQFVDHNINFDPVEVKGYRVVYQPEVLVWDIHTEFLKRQL